ncbi:MAG: 5-methylcytosine-specific restriction endonuclease system specificity protein McrC [Planctomycetales bacterium]|nr:5-methylcytosine-specific restriction endonuclease system specificity protein McrC [bacterium]UNM09691.1 MAG: 5-methylcytosine-specific restriction endonuclease system specificity protein McrC [Planctomycetales bacterium]
MTDQVLAHEGTETAQAFVGRIPVRNIWLLMLYASRLRNQQEFNKAGVEDNPDQIPDLVAEYLARIVEVRLRRSLNYSFSTRSADVQRVRGRIDLLRTERRSLLSQGSIHCHFSELTVDSPRNRYVMAALERASHLVKDKSLVRRCRDLCDGLSRMGVSGRMPTPAELNSDRSGFNDRHDQKMLEAARLMLEFAIPAESAGPRRLERPDREEKWLRQLFEQAVAGFYDVMLTPGGWKVVTGRKLAWDRTEETWRIAELMPEMRTDIVLEHHSSDRRIVIDTKFTEIVKANQFGREKLKSGYIYQLYTYLFSQINQGDLLADAASGMLLHPAIDTHYCETVCIQGHNLRFATVNLAGSAMEIKEHLLDAVDGL